MKKKIIFGLLIALSTVACVREDIIDDEQPEAVRITTSIPSAIAVDGTINLEAIFINKAGARETRPIIWTSSEPEVIEVTREGLARALKAGSSVVSAALEETAEVLDSVTITVVDDSMPPPPAPPVSQEIVIKNGTLSGDYDLSGSFTIREKDGKQRVVFEDDFFMTSIPAPYIYLSNSTAVVDDAVNLGRINQLTGTSSYEIPEDVNVNEFQFVFLWCEAFSIPIGSGEIQNP